jgi:hypothetical protein
MLDPLSKGVVDSLLRIFAMLITGESDNLKYFVDKCQVGCSLVDDSDNNQDFDDKGKAGGN